MKILKFLNRKKVTPQEIKKKERPSDWTLTVNELFNEFNTKKRKSIQQYEVEWAKDYERSLYPKNTVFPRKGYLYESIEDQEISYMTAWKAPFTGGGKSIIKKGERIWIKFNPNEENPTSTYALPVDYEKIEERMVPENERNNPKYNGFYFCLSTPILNNKFKLVNTNFIEDKYKE